MSLVVTIAFLSISYSSTSTHIVTEQAISAIRSASVGAEVVKKS